LDYLLVARLLARLPTTLRRSTEDGSSARGSRGVSFARAVSSRVCVSLVDSPVPPASGWTPYASESSFSLFAHSSSVATLAASSSCPRVNSPSLALKSLPSAPTRSVASFSALAVSSSFSRAAFSVSRSCSALALSASRSVTFFSRSGTFAAVSSRSATRVFRPSRSLAGGDQFVVALLGEFHLVLRAPRSSSL
jgi:hypothetical protein